MSTVIRGDTEYWDIPIVDTENQPVDLTNHSVWVTVKGTPDENDTEALYQHYIRVDGDGNVVASEGMTLKDDNPALGIIVQKLTPEESSLFATGSYTYDLQVMLPNGDIKTLLRGESETVLPDWTRAITAPEAE